MSLNYSLTSIKLLSRWEVSCCKLSISILYWHVNVLNHYKILATRFYHFFWLWKINTYPSTHHFFNKYLSLLSESKSFSRKCQPCKFTSHCSDMTNVPFLAARELGKRLFHALKEKVAWNRRVGIVMLGNVCHHKKWKEPQVEINLPN